MITIRSLEQNEVYDALNLVKEVFFSEGNLGYSRQGAQSFLEFLSAKGELLEYLGAYDAALEGILAYTEDFHIALLFVRKERQKTGIAKGLFQEFLKLAKARAVSRITVNAAKPAVPVYEALGFEAYGEETTKDGITSLPMEYLINQEMLGRTVTVTVDRPYGSLHPHYPDTEYPCNYGYVEEVLAGDGEFQDAYIIGVYEPVEQFTGVVTAIIYRRNDSESKWVVTKDGTCSKQEVIDAVGELEQYFDTRIIWLEDHVIN
jgi:inorganic pyrophosphatase